MFKNRKSNYYESLENHVFGPPEHGNVKLLAQTQTSYGWGGGGFHCCLLIISKYKFPYTSGQNTPLLSDL